MTKPEIRLVPYNEKMVSVTVGNQTYSISEKKDKELIDKGKDYKKLLSRKNPIKRNFLYGLWVNIYKESGYNFYLEPIQMKLFDSKWKRAINNFFRKEKRRKK
tara:strand:+ start:371 stop:679 length:309 start_codon:yes stop_codon:yes gene_type:complete